MTKVGYKHSDATKKKISKAKKGKKMSEVQKKKISKTLKGRPAHNKGKPMLEATKQKISKTLKGYKYSTESQQRIDDSRKRKMSDITKEKISNANKGKHSPYKGKPRSEATKKRISAVRQCVTYDEWETFACEKKYCPKFNEVCREANRDKYGMGCFICGLHQSENKDKNGKVRKLSVHHVDMDKAQGCESNWKLVPLCMKCHANAHNDELIARLGYILKV